MKKVTFNTLLNEIKLKWENEGKDTSIYNLELFFSLKLIFEFIYYEKKWSFQENDYPNRLGSLYDFVLEMFHDLNSNGDKSDQS